MGGESPTKKMVERVKEVLHDFSEEEIRAMLQECNMDPNEAVERLVVQDTFHEVKSKRERRKEVKEMQELKLQGGSNISNWDSDLDAGNFSNAYKNQTCYAESSLSRSSYAYPPTAEAINEKSAHMSAPAESKTSTADNVIVSPRLAEARSYLQDVMRRSEGYDSGDSSGGASGRSQDSSEQISPHSQTRCHQSSRDSDAAVIAMSTSSGVLLPSHVQALAAECLNLTFGTYKTHLSSTNSGQSKSDPSKEADGSSMQQLCLPEHLLNDILEPANNFSEGNQEELSKNQPNMGTPFGDESLQNNSDSISQDTQYMQINLNSGSNTESSLPYFRRRDMLNSTYPPDVGRYNKAVASMKSQAISIPEHLLGADYDKAVKLPHQNYLNSDEVSSHSSDMLINLNSGSNTESTLQHFRRWHMLNSTYPPDVGRYNKAVSSMKSQAISIPEQILGADYDKAVKLPHQFFDMATQHNHTLDGAGNCGGFPNTPQNYGHNVEEVLHHLAAANSSRFGSSAHSRGSFLPNASVVTNSPPGFLPNASVAPNAPPGFLPTSVAPSAPPGFLPNVSVATNAPPGFETQFNDRNPFPGLIGSNTVLDYGVRSGAMPNAQEQRAYESLLDYVRIRSGAMANAQEQRAYESLLDYGVRSGAMPNAQEQRAYDNSVEAQYRYLASNANLSLNPNNYQ